MYNFITKGSLIIILIILLFEYFFTNTFKSLENIWLSILLIAFLAGIISEVLKYISKKK